MSDQRRPRPSHWPATITANLNHACVCGATLTLTGPRPAPDFDWWLDKLAEHAGCAS